MTMSKERIAELRSLTNDTVEMGVALELCDAIEALQRELDACESAMDAQRQRAKDAERSMQDARHERDRYRATQALCGVCGGPHDSMRCDA